MAVSTSPENKQSAPVFLGLPAEIRFQIYDLVFTGSSFWMGRDCGRAGPQQVVRPDGCEARYQILLTCRPVYQEARWLWYYPQFTPLQINHPSSFMAHD